MQGIKSTNFEFPGQKAFYQGKVRDVYTIDDLIVVITTDRISAFDHVLPKPIPQKGQVLNQIAAFFLEATQDIVPNWLISQPHPNVSIGKLCDPIKLEMVVRGYLAGHAWRLYRAGERTICGVHMPDGMREGDRFPQPIITPATKADEGHDEDISESDLLKKEIVSENTWSKLKAYSLALFNRGSQMAKEKGLLLVDTKYEFGWWQGEILLIDEVHTPDSSRYYYVDGYEERQQNGISQKQLSKEFVREWLMKNGFQGLEGQQMPDMPEAFVQKVSQRYQELYRLMTGDDIQPIDTGDLNQEIYQAVVQALKTLNKA